MRYGLLLLLLVSLAPASFAQEDAPGNWPRWRGPLENGTAADGADPPVNWGPDQNVKWKTQLTGSGSSTPVIWGNQIIILSAVKTDRDASGNVVPATTEADDADEPSGRRRGRGFGGGSKPKQVHQFIASSYDRRNGDQLWQTILAQQVPHEAGHATNTFASASPLTDGKRIWVSFGSRGIFCLDMQGNQIWKRELGEMQTRNSFGEGSSPALHENTLVVPWDHEGQSYVAALDASTGEPIWKTDRDELTTWATPLITTYKDRTQVILNGTRVRSYDLASGELLWECDGQASNPIACPVRFKDMVICMTGYRGYAIQAIGLDAKGDVNQSDQLVWSRSDAAPYVASPALYKGTLYFTKSREGIVSSVDASNGEVLIGQQRLPGISSVYASPVAAADRIYFTGREGTTVVIKRGPELEVIATNNLGEAIDASPAIIGNEMYLRGEKHLYCLSQ
ncbi:PQQ-binding-like beta-propeller repeat protein [Stieleria sp. TO1_6]|uniref:outer membrane protein assembly factor BamB family protein n=1 Tax=Stieleria tagensis TaxID=2956795 RepID=UPI00209AD123|nr:PQQ-binding-like beta-propeller repeat protein [Stieleria tagensis]MCO8122864.1 PQQ-binding-like beta-propeller repeat protein [Stieleria tagensis]